MLRRNKASPPTEIVSRLAPWKASHIDLVPSGGVTGELQRHGDSGRAARGEEDLGEGGRGKFDQSAGEVDRRPIGVAARAEGQTVKFGLDRRHDLWMAVAELMHAVAMEVEDCPTFNVEEQSPLGPFNDVEAWRRKRLVDEIALVIVEQSSRFGVQSRAPGAAQGRAIDVAFGGRGIVRRHGRSPRSSRLSIMAITGRRSATLSMT
jgi:hypothetical protein